MLFRTSWQLAGVVVALLVVEFIEATIRSRGVSHRYSMKYTDCNSEVKKAAKKKKS